MSRPAVHYCCALGHGLPAPDTYNPLAYAIRFRVPDLTVEASVRSIIELCDARRNNPRFAAAGDRLRDWLTVRTLTAELDALEAARG